MTHSTNKPNAVLQVSTDLLVELCKGLAKGDDLRYYRVIKNGLPDDARVVSASLSGHPECATVLIILESDSFTDGEVLPPPRLEAVKA